jgi:hypothetical protein
LLIVAPVAAVGGAAIYLLALRALWRTSWLYRPLFAGLGAARHPVLAVSEHHRRQRHENPRQEAKNMFG